MQGKFCKGKVKLQETMSKNQEPMVRIIDRMGSPEFEKIVKINTTYLDSKLPVWLEKALTQFIIKMKEHNDASKK